MKILTEGKGHELEEVVKCNYLVVETTNTREERGEIQERINKGNKCMSYAAAQIKNIVKICKEEDL